VCSSDLPAAAVIPAPVAYIKVVAVKKLVVEFLESEAGPRNAVPCLRCPPLGRKVPCLDWLGM